MQLFNYKTERPEPIGYDKTKASKLMRKNELDILILNSPENVFYASGLPVRHQEKNPILFALRNQYPAIAFIHQDGDESLVLWDVFDKRLTWIENVKGSLSPKSALRSMKSILRKSRVSDGNIGVESTMPLYQYQFIKENFPQANIEIADEMILGMQLIKSNEEIKRITESTRIAEVAIKKMIDATNVGISDVELIQIAKRTVIEEGAEGWDHFTMSIGESDPEAPGIGLKVEQDQITRYDVGAIYRGYISDVNRHAYVGVIPKNLNDAIEAIVQVQNACQKAIKPGTNPKDIQEVAFKAWRDAGREDQFIIMAHSLGLRTEEYHFFDPMGKIGRNFEVGNVFDLEAWTLLKGLGTVGNEDTYILTKNGCKRLSSLEMKVFQK